MNVVLSEAVLSRASGGARNQGAPRPVPKTFALLMGQALIVIDIFRLRI
jgi:hypothetical protein